MRLSATGANSRSPRRAASRPLSAADLVPTLFDRELDAHQTGFAFGEVLAHVNYMRGRGELAREQGDDGVFRYRTT